MPPAIFRDIGNPHLDRACGAVDRDFLPDGAE